jgi:hypothetical protein
MANFDLLPIFAQTYDVGRASLWLTGTGTFPDEVPAYWDGLNEATFFHFGNTEGEMAPVANSEYSTLTLPENTGPAPLKAYLAGHAPTFTLSGFADPRILRLFTPTGIASGGNSRQVRVLENTLWVAPEQLFIKQVPGSADEAVQVVYSGGVWTKDGNSFNDEDQRLFDLSVFFWKVYFEVTMTPYRHENGGKGNMEGTCHVMFDTTKPEGHQLWTTGATLLASGINLGGESS